MSEQQKHRRIGPYELERRLGRGGQADVWRARSANTGERCALKLYPLGVDEEQGAETRRRVDREVRALGSVQVPGIVRVFGHGEEKDAGPTNDGFIWVAYELVDGVDLATALDGSVPPSSADCLALLERLAPDLRLVHTQGLVHRDIKPNNILLRGAEWTAPVLVDFGYVKALTSDKLTVTGRAVGTFGYLAPEVMKSADCASAASDQWSLARVFAEALAVAHGAEMAELGETQPHPLVEMCIDPAAPATASAILQALARDPAERFSDVEQFAAAVRQAMLTDGLIAEVNARIGMGTPWNGAEPLKEYFTRLGYEVRDKRDRPQGNLWIVASYDEFSAIAEHLVPAGVRLLFASGGSKTTQGRPGWWTKSAL